jgi:bacterial/archaeal transporter family protein
MASTWLWLPLALLSAVSAALVAIFGKMGLHKVDTTAATMLRAMVMFLLLLGMTVATGKFSSAKAVSGREFLFIILAGAAGAASWLFYFWALKVGKASQVAPIDRLSAVFAVALAAMFLGESVGWKTAVGSGLIAVGAIFVALG